MNYVLSKHAQEQLVKPERQIPREVFERVMVAPEQVVPGEVYLCDKQS